MAAVDDSTVTIGVASLDEVKRRLAAAFRGKRQGNFITFTSEERLWDTLRPKRLALLKALVGKGPVGLRELARLLGRDVHAVHRDTSALVKARILQKDEAGRIEFPYERIHVDFTIEAAA